MKTKIRNSISGLTLIPLVLACFALLPSVQATPDPGVVGGGISNAGDGFGAMNAGVSGSNNSGFGANALHNLTSGNNNAAQGNSALFSLTSGFTNTAIGVLALRNNVSGSQNTAVGYRAIEHNTLFGNTAVGWKALNANTGGDGSVAIGDSALLVNTDVGGDVAVGSLALSDHTTGSQNTAVGRRSLEFSMSGSNNTALGWRSGDGMTTASGTVCIGAGVNGDNISNRTFIRNVGSTVQPFVNDVIEFVTVNVTNNKMGRQASSRRYKEDIKPMEKSSELIYQLKPVRFRYKKTAEYPNPGVDYGLVAEDVAEVAPELAIRNGEGQIESLRYMAIYNMMLNEFLKEHKKVEEQQASIADLKATVALQQKGMEVLTAQLKEQAAQIQKVSAQVEVNKPAPRTVANK